MGKRVSASLHFNSAGRRAASMGLPITWLKVLHGLRYYSLPNFARVEFARGWLDQCFAGKKSP